MSHDFYKDLKVPEVHTSHYATETQSINSFLEFIFCYYVKGPVLSTMHAGIATMRFTSLNKSPVGQTAIQTVLLILCWLAGAGLARLADVPLPGSILGMVLLIILLFCGAVEVPHVARGAGFLLGHMMLFLIPASMVVFDHPELFGLVGLKIMAVITVSTFMVMIAAAWMSELCLRWLERRSD